MHRIIFIHYNGPISEGLEIDHIDQNKLNLLPSNLRAVTHRVNLHNRKLFKNNTSGFIGVSWNRSNKCWEAKVRANGKRFHLGSFKTPQEAAAAVNNAYQKYHPDVQVPNPLI